MTPTGYFLDHLWLIPLFPLATAALMLLFGKRLPNSGVSVLCVSSVGLSFLYALGAVFQLLAAEPEHRFFQKVLFEWLTPGPMQMTGGHTIPFVADWGYLLDPLSCVMVLVVTGVGFLIHVYSIGYMEHEGGYYRFFGYLNLFMFAMLTLVLANNMLLMFVGWEGVGLCSYLLIGFYFLKKSASDAGKKAFIVNRIGDAGFILGILLTAVTLGTVRFTSQGLPDVEGASGILQALKTAVDGHALAFGAPVLTGIALLLFIGAMGKSAQIPLHTWLPDAMEGPTPVSALIHAATMVTAGVFMVARLSPMFEYAPGALAVVGVIGGTTAIFAASVGMAQNDIKRVIAYSTCSQLGYMFFAAGVSAYGAAMFHLFTHAFFKALLFLGAGSVIHAMSAEQDMRRMGGLWNKIPITYALMWIGSLSLAGIPFFAGYYSKDMILAASWASGTAVGRYSYCLGIFTAFLTAFYSWRLLIMTFHGQPRADEETLHHVHEGPWIMLIPLFVLAAGAAVAGYFAEEYFVGHERVEFWKHSILVLPQHDSIAAAEHVSWIIDYLPLIAGLLGIAVAYVCYSPIPELPSRLAMRFRAIYLFLLNKWYFDELYDRLFVRTAFSLGEGLWKTGDATIIDGLGPDGIAAATRELAREASRLQTGYVYHYAFAMLIGVVALVTWYLLPR